ncbi:hypothetical protein WJX82_009993 [Trebouxia sp. C0006]
MSDDSLDEADDTSAGEQDEEEIVELSEEDLLQLLDNQEPALQVCSRLFYQGWEKHTRFSCLNQSQISDLKHRGFIIKDECLAETVCEQLHAQAVQLHSAGDMEKAAKVGLMSDMPLDKFTDVSARGDSITWLREGSASGPGGSAGLQAMQLLQEVQADLHSVMHLEKRSAEYQLAVYVGGGSQYVKHRDALPDDGADPHQRRVTAILYANPNWRPARGGQLRIWLPPGASSPSASPPPGTTDEPQQSALGSPEVPGLSDKLQDVKLQKSSHSGPQSGIHLQEGAPSSVAVDWLHGSTAEASTTRTISGPVLLPSQQPPLPVTSTQTTEILRSTVRTTAIRLVSLDGSSSPGPTSTRSSWAEPPQRQSPLKIGYSWKSLFGLQQSGQLKVVLQAPGHEPSLVTFGSSGRGQEGGFIEFGPDETRGRLEVIVQSGSRTVAGGIISVDELWQLAKAPARPCYSPQRTKPKSHSLVDKLARTFSGQSIAESEPMYGNVWVYVNDQNGRRYGSVLVSAWLGTKMDTVTTTTPDVPRPLMPQSMISHDFTSVVSQPQEQTPVTCWEAYDSCLAAAIRDQKKGRSDLQITGKWRWLLDAFAETYGVRTIYATLAYLDWVVGPDVISCTSDCLKTLIDKLEHLKAVRANPAQRPQDQAILGLMTELRALTACLFITAVPYLSIHFHL